MVVCSADTSSISIFEYDFFRVSAYQLGVSFRWWCVRPTLVLSIFLSTIFSSFCLRNFRIRSIRSDLFGCVRMYSDAFRSDLSFSEACRNFFELWLFMERI